ncbi:hypothetical protein QLX08_010205 [Tetragonisca angustula]|uniref:Uncharacterized protein n=1 Tax=Tetragonisca angustula TaxID=166442 RepID=A0AAW0ZDY9_9HYME
MVIGRQFCTLVRSPFLEIRTVLLWRSIEFGVRHKPKTMFSRQTRSVPLADLRSSRVSPSEQLEDCLMCQLASPDR